MFHSVFSWLTVQMKIRAGIYSHSQINTITCSLCNNIGSMHITPDCLLCSVLHAASWKQRCRDEQIRSIKCKTIYFWMHKLVLLFCTSENSMPSNFRLIRNIGTPPSCWLQTQPSIIMGDQNFCHYRKHSEKLITPFPGVVKEYFTGFSANYYLVWMVWV